MLAGATLLAATLAGAPAQAASHPPKPSPNDRPTVAKMAPKGKPGKLTRALSPAGKLLAGPFYHYVGGRQLIAAPGYAGITANFWVGNPGIHTGSAPQDGGGTHSLAEIAVESADQQQSVEVGWIKDPGICAADPTNPCLFVGAWVNNVFQGYNGGFVDYAPSTLDAGDSLASYVGTAPALEIQYFSGAWWVEAAGQWVGYFPGTLWSGVSPGFTAGRMFQLFGEVASTETDGKPCSDMGTGDQGSSGGSGTSVARISSATYIGSGGVLPSLTYFRSPTIAGYTNVTPSTRSFWYGGPGYNGAGTGVGTKGSC